MDWQGQINKLEEKLYKVREKKKKILEDEKELLEKLKNARQKKEEDDNRKLMAMVEEQLGEMSESKLQALKSFLARHAGEFVGEEKIFRERKPKQKKNLQRRNRQGQKNFQKKKSLTWKIILILPRKTNQKGVDTTGQGSKIRNPFYTGRISGDYTVSRR